jgi:hypothetical protein
VYDTRDYYSEQQQQQESYNDDESIGYSPVLENYTRFSTATIVVPEVQQQEQEQEQEQQQQQQQQQQQYYTPPIKTIINRTPSTSSSNSSTSINKPPVSPSFLRVGSNNSSGDYFKQQKEDVVFTTRSSSLNRTTSSASGKSIISKNAGFSNPTSPLAFEINHHQTLHETLLEGGEQDFPNHALLSFISSRFINEVTLLNQRRKIFCTDEYPLSFNGEEAMVSLPLLLYLLCVHTKQLRNRKSFVHFYLVD